MGPLSALALLSSCTFEYFNQGEIIQNGHSKLYSHPYWTNSFSNTQRHRKIVIVATNDTLGQIEANWEKTKHAKMGKDINYQVGGYAVLARYFEILRQKFPQQTLFLDAGNIYQGTLLSDLGQGESVVKLYNELNYDAITIGSSDFEFGPMAPDKNIASLDEDPQGQLKKNIAQHKAPYVISNLIDLKSARPIQWKNTFPYIMKEVNGVQVAIIGGISSFAWKSTRKENLRGLYIRKLSSSLIKYAHLARQKGAEVVIALLHSGGQCGQQFIKKYNTNKHQVNFSPKGKNFCNPKHEIFQVIDNIPKGTIDAVVAGHSRSKIANVYRDIPVIQSFSNGNFLGRIELIYDRATKRVDSHKTHINQPTKLCHQFFQASQDCYSGDPTMKLQKLVPATFLGKLVYPDPHIAGIIAKYQFMIQEKSQRKIIELDTAMNRELLKPSTLKSIISYSIRKATDAQIGLISDTKTTLKGDKDGGITYQDIYEALPRESYLSKISVSGKELKQLAEIATSGNGPQFGQFSGIKIVLHNGVLEERDLNNDGKKEDWEKNRLKSIRLSDGSKIEDDRMYTVGTQTFLSEDNAGKYDFIFSNISKDRKIIFHNKTNRQALLDLFQSMARDRQALKKILDHERNWLITI